MTSRRRALIVALGAAVALLLAMGGGAAYAYFSSHGSGSGVATAGTGPQSVTIVAATGTPTSSLQPGGSADLTLTLNNPNSFAVKITGISQNGTLTVAGDSGCTASNSGVTVPTQTGLSVTIPAGSGQVAHIANGAAMSSSSNSGCQGAQFQVPVTVTVQEG